MNHGNRCVAAWCAETGKMVRPLPDGRNWTAEETAAGRIAPGALIDVTPSGVEANGAHPHLNEDLPIIPGLTRFVSAERVDWFNADAPPVAVTLAEAFEGNIRDNGPWGGHRKGVHVLPGTECRSLWGLNLERASIQFVEIFNKLKVLVNDGDNRYQLSVSSQTLKQEWDQRGLIGIARVVPTRGVVHVRVGLAREYQGKCYVMVNGINW